MLIGAAVGGTGCAAPRRGPGTPPTSLSQATAAQSRPAALPARARQSFEKLGSLPELPGPTELVDRTVSAEALKHYLAGTALAEEYLDAEAVEEFEAAIAADPAGFEPRLALGRAALRAGDLPKAQGVLEAAVKQRPRSSEAHYLLGLVTAGRGEDATALRQLRYALTLAENDGQRLRIYFHLAQILERQEYCQATVEIALRFEKLVQASIADLQNSDIQLQPQWRDLIRSHAWRVPSLRGACLRRLGKPAEAVGAYETALKMGPGNPEVLEALGETLIDAGDTRRAAEVAQKMLSIQPNNTTALAMLAATLEVDHRREELRERLLQLVRQNPSDLLLAQRVASIFLKFDQLDAALQTLLITRKSISEPAPVYASLMQIVLANDSLQPAVDGLASLLEQMEPPERDLLLGPIDLLTVSPKLARDMRVHGPAVLARVREDGTKLLALGVIAGAARQPVLAEKALRLGLERRPDSLLTAVTLGEQLLAQCRWNDAIGFAEPLTSRFKNSSDLYRILGTAYDGLDDLKPAMANLYEALRQDRKDTRSMWQAAQINDRLGQAQPASSIYQVLVTIQPDAWAAQIALVKDLLALRQKDTALEHAKRLKETLPTAAAVDLCLLMAQLNDPIPPSGKIAALLKQHPDDANLLQALAEAHLAEGDADATVEVLLALLANDPAHEEARLLLTTALSRQLEPDLAMQVLQSLLVEHPNRILWRLAQAELLSQMGRPGDAAEIILSLLQTPWGQEQKHSLMNRLMLFLEAAGEHERAIRLQQEALRASPDDRAAQAQLLGVLESQGKRAQALELLRSWRRHAASDPLLRRLEVQYLRALGASEAAAAEVLRDWPAGKEASGKDLPAREPGRYGAHDQDVLLLAGAMPAGQTAEWLASRAWLSPPDLSASSLAEAVADETGYVEAIELGRLANPDEESLARATQWTFLAGQRAPAELVLMPQMLGKNAQMHERLTKLLSTFYKRMGLQALALRQTEATYERYKNTERAGEAANDLAYSYAELGMNLARAEPLAKRAAAGDTGSAAYMDTLAWVYYKEGRFAEALRWLNQAVRVPGQGDDPVLLDHLGDVSWRVGKHAEALEAWRKAAGLYAEQLKSDRLRDDLRQGLEGVTAKIRAVESRKPPPVAARAGESAGKS